MATSTGHVNVEGAEIYYETEGQGTPLLLLHGGFGGAWDFASQFPEFAKRYKVIAFERSGHGHTADAGEPFTYRKMADQTVAFMAKLELGRCHLLGWSDGATVALLVTLKRPDLVRSLVYISQNRDASGLTPGFRKWLESLTLESFWKDAPELAKRYEDTSPDGPSHLPVVLEKTKRLWMNEPDMELEELAQVSVPTLVITGDRDLIPVEHTVEIAKSIRGSQLFVVPRATHFLLSERPELVNPAILGFFRDVETPPQAEH